MQRSACLLWSTVTFALYITYCSVSENFHGCNLQFYDSRNGELCNQLDASCTHSGYTKNVCPRIRHILIRRKDDKGVQIIKGGYTLIVSTNRMLGSCYRYNHAHAFHATRIYPSSSGYFALVVAISALPMTSQNVVGIGTPMSVHVLEIIPSDTFVQSKVMPPSAQTKQLLHCSPSAPSPAFAVQTRPDPSSASPPSLNPIISFESTSRHNAKGVVKPTNSG